MLEWSMENIDLTITSYFQDVSWVFEISIMFSFLNNINPKIKLTINIKKNKKYACKIKRKHGSTIKQDNDAIMLWFIVVREW